MSESTTYSVGDVFRPYLKFDYIPIPEPIFKYYDLTPSEKMLYGLLCKYIGKKDYCWPLQTTLADDLNISVSQVRRMLKVLEDKKFIKREVLSKPRRYTRYYVIIHPIFEGKFKNKEFKLISMDAYLNDSMDANEKGSMDAHSKVASMHTAKRGEKVSENVKGKSILKNAVLTDIVTTEKLQLDNIDKGLVESVVDYWNTRPHTTTHKGKQTLKKADKEIKVLLDRGYKINEFRRFFDWYSNSRNDPKSRLYYKYKTGDWYKFSLPEVLRFSPTQKKLNADRPSVAGTLSGISSLFETFMMDDIERFLYPKDEVNEPLVNLIRDKWNAYQSMFEYGEFNSDDDKLFVIIANKIEKFYKNIRHKLNLRPYRETVSIHDVVDLVFDCIQDKRYELHWIAAGNFYKTTLINYLANNGFLITQRHCTEHDNDPTIEDWTEHEDHIDSIFYKP